MKLTNRTWFVEEWPDVARIRCSYKRHGKRLLQFTVQLEIVYLGAWQAVVRYDNAHGFCHRDILHPDGTQDKTPMFVGNANQTFSAAIREMRANWQAHRDRFLKETQS